MADEIIKDFDDPTITIGDTVKLPKIPNYIYGWIKVSKRLPNEDEWVLLTDGERYWVGKFDSVGTFYCKCCLENLYGVKFWRSLPELPNE